MRGWKEAQWDFFEVLTLHLTGWKCSFFCHQTVDLLFQQSFALLFLRMLMAEQRWNAKKSHLRLIHGFILVVLTSVEGILRAAHCSENVTSVFFYKILTRLGGIVNRLMRIARSSVAGLCFFFFFHLTNKVWIYWYCSTLILLTLLKCSVTLTV